MTVDTGRLSAFKKLAYGAGELGPAMAGSTMIFFQMIFLTNVAGLNPALAGSVLMVGKIWDAINDPLIGWLSDRTRSRWGRRLPWMVVAIGPFAVFFFLQWCIPGFIDAQSQWGLFTYYTVVALLYNTAYTALALPHSALTPELSQDYDERSRLTGFRMAYSLAGSVGGLIVALVVFRALSHLGEAGQYQVFAAVVALIGIGAVIFCLWGIWQPALASEKQRKALQGPVKAMPIRHQLRIVFANKPFLIVCGIYLCSWMAMQFTASILPYYVQSWMQLPSDRFQLLALVVQLTALFLIPFWSWLAVRVGKKPVYFYGMAFWLVAQAGLLFLLPGQVSWMFFLGFLAGFGISVCYLIPNAMLPDVIEYDELQTGQRREGVFYGFFVFLQKMALALATFVVGLALEAAGYVASAAGQPEPVQPESALWAIRLAIGPLPALALVLGLILAWWFPITKARHQEILRQLAARRAG